MLPSGIVACFVLGTLAYGAVVQDSSPTSTSPYPEYCKPFVEGQPEQRTFFSPGYPNAYPNNSDCIKVLSARKGQLIKLDFRNYFDVEASQDCRYDYLEVRDGAHGYSPLVEQGRFCGGEFPPVLTSQGRHLWLRFVSDDNIEYRGFVAVYEFVPKPTPPFYQPEMDECQFELEGTEGFVNKTDVSAERLEHSVKYGVPLDCMWIVRVDPDKKIQLMFPHFQLQKPNECESNFVDVFSRTDTPHRLNSFCGSIAEPVDSVDNVLYVRFVAEPRAINSTFSAMFTAYREKKKKDSAGGSADCEEDEYDCEDNTCIDVGLKCNGRANCRYKWDEDECHSLGDSAWMQSDHIVIILAVFSTILLGMSVAFVFNCVKKLVEDHRTIREHARQSREANLDTVCEQTKLESNRSSLALSPDTTDECYVPDEDPPRPEMCDSCCQTRESLFLKRQPSSERSFSPPPPPPVDYSKKPAAGLSTFKPSSTFRTETVIDVNRPYSHETTKSAPDVICMTH